MHYNDYGPEDFASDPDFIQWVLRPDPGQDAFWKEWLHQHPEKAAVLAEARKMVRFFRFRAALPSEIEKQHVKRQIMQRIQAPGSAPVYEKVHRFSYLKIAAALAMLLLGAGILWQLYFFPPYSYYQTGYSESRRVILADSTVVQMNANSELKVKNHLSEEKPREVWLDGEAFFKVVKQPNVSDGRFLVHTDKLTVEVLGTAFNVQARRGNTQVVLNEGKIRLRQKAADESLLMEPGEMALLEGEHPLVLSKVNPEKATSWKDNRLFFDNASLREIFLRIQDIHGYQIRVSNPALLERQFTGSCPINKPEILFAALSETFNLYMTREDKQVILRPKRSTKSE